MGHSGMMMSFTSIRAGFFGNGGGSVTGVKSWLEKSKQKQHKHETSILTLTAKPHVSFNDEDLEIIYSAPEYDRKVGKPGALSVPELRELAHYCETEMRPTLHKKQKDTSYHLYLHGRSKSLKLAVRDRCKELNSDNGCGGAKSERKSGRKRSNTGPVPALGLGAGLQMSAALLTTSSANRFS